MTVTKKLLRALMEDGEPRTALQIAQMLGVSEIDARMSIANWRRDGYLASAPVVYTITEKGRARAEREPVAKAKPKQKPPPEDMVRASIRRNPTSVFNMGMGNGLNS